MMGEALLAPAAAGGMVPAGGSGGGIQHSYQVAVAETVILLHPLFLTCRCLNRDGEGIVSKMTVPPTAIILPGRDRLP